MILNSSHRLAARIPDSRSGDASSSLAGSTCPHCGDQVGPDDDVITTEGLPISPGNFMVCFSCREIIRFNHQLQLVELKERDWLDLFHQKDLFVAMLRWRMRLLVDQLQAGYHATEIE